jgi:16S rRNA C967 or C1407 C5-methylase (RsmB/RsmF family)/NOL1/NOP2/fmu family ribosome biogenesis protein
MIFPESFIHKTQLLLSEEAEAFLKTLQGDAPVSVRFNSDKFPENHEWKKNEKVAWCNSAIYLEKRPVFTLDPLIHAGAYYVQEASSMFLEQAFKNLSFENEELRVLDLCAAPGGKSTHLLSLLNDKSLLVSNEVIRSRVGVLTENLMKWGKPNFIVTNNDSEDFKKLNYQFDVVVVDAPCSGEGLFRKDKEAVKEWSEENVNLCVARQSRILEGIEEIIKPEGYLIYSTCTYEASENELQIEQLLQSGNFEHVEISIKEFAGIEKRKYGYQFYPHKLKGEGFYIACLKKINHTAQSWRVPKKHRITISDKKTTALLNEMIKEPINFMFFQKQDVSVAFPKAFFDDLIFLSENLNVRYTGVEIGKMSAKEFIPSHHLALSTIINKDKFLQINLTYDEAIAYLRRDEIKLEIAEKEGWTLFCYEQLPIGWAKVLKNRINNYYPIDWRIRMNAK